MVSGVELSRPPSDALALTHKWRLGDLIIWDNRCTMHHRTPVDPTQPRAFYRTLFKGEPPVAPWDEEGKQASALFAGSGVHARLVAAARLGSGTRYHAVEGEGSMTMRNALVTGSSGLVGLPLAERLAAEGCVVTGLDPVMPPEGIGYEALRGDLRDVHQVYRVLRERDIDTIIHSGAISGGMLARDDPFRVCDLNIVGTVHLLEAARAFGLRRFVYISSCSAYGHTPPGPVGEEAPLRPGTVYSATKGAGDLLVMAYRSQFDMDAVSLRIGGIYGPGRSTWCVIKTMVENAVAGHPTHFDWGAGETRIHMYVDDTVEAIVRAARAPERAPEPVYNVTRPDMVSMDRIGEIVCDRVPGIEITFQTGGSPMVYRRAPFDVSLVARDFGFTADTTIEDGIARYVAWERKRRQDGGGLREPTRSLG